jgi:hypothetical protein
MLSLSVELPQSNYKLKYFTLTRLTKIKVYFDVVGLVQSE